ncbi:hypothetical protein M3J09_011489 [Ascochyta lentis]
MAVSLSSSATWLPAPANIWRSLMSLMCCSSARTVALIRSFASTMNSLLFSRMPPSISMYECSVCASAVRYPARILLSISAPISILALHAASAAMCLALASSLAMKPSILLNSNPLKEASGLDAPAVVLPTPLDGPVVVWEVLDDTAAAVDAAAALDDDDAAVLLDPRPRPPRPRLRGAILTCASKSR